ncbi:MAG TPA: O-antigen ligase family protein, partial [Blastocatellia bacterium]|nr:O-antigen ligase family protein [Blastocatellia bacterium]
MSEAKRMATVTAAIESRTRTAAFWLAVSLLVFVPLVFSVGIRRIFCLPKFAILLVSSSALVPLILLAARRRGELSRVLLARHTVIVWLYLIVVAVSTIFGVAPVASLFGSFENQMGLITQGCFFVCFLGLKVGIGASQARLERALWAMALTGLAAAVFASLQFFGYDPFLPASVYTFNSAAGPVVRVTGTLGHSNYLGNFLLYTTPMSAGLALASRGRARYLALAAAALAVAAIAFSGTRGAWVGLVVGLLTFAALQLSGGAVAGLWARRRQVWFKVGLGCIIVAVAIGIIGAHPASRNILLRARSFVAEGMTGSGRTLLWRDAVRMAPDFALVGCGPEGFRKAFLAYKSEQLAQFAPQVNNESSHNAYLDAAISYGLPGAILYVAIIASTLRLMFIARRRAASPGLRAMFTGLFSSLVAVSTHNLFIFDQIPTGLYFFAFAALGGVVANLAGAEKDADENHANSQTRDSPAPAHIKGTTTSNDAVRITAKARKGKRDGGRRSEAGRARWPDWVITVAGGALVIIAAWYAVAVLRADADL